MKEKISFEIVLNSVIDAENEIGTELDYSLLDISNQDNFNIYKDFIRQKKLILPSKNKTK